VRNPIIWFLIGRSERKRPVERPRSRREDNTEVSDTKVLRTIWLFGYKRDEVKDDKENYIMRNFIICGRRLMNRTFSTHG
jgi:hypothetical protein